jgi:hypothetical protein
MAADDYRARAAELLARSKLERDPEVADLLETIARGFQQRGVRARRNAPLAQSGRWPSRPSISR